MSKEEKKKEVNEGEGTPPFEAGGMVSEEMLIDNIKKVNRGEEIKGLVPNKETLLLFAIEQLYDLKEAVLELVDVFKGTDKSIPKPRSEQKKPVAPSTPKEKTSTKPVSSRVEEIVAEFQKFGDMVTINTETSAMFIIVKPTRFLGTDDFAKIGAVSRKFGGEWISQGKNSYFNIPKMVGEAPKGELKTEELKTEELKTEELKTEVPSTGIGAVKALFPTDLGGMLTFEDAGEYSIIKPRQFLGSDNFAKIAAIVRSAGGEYISAGKQSHFKVPIPK